MNILKINEDLKLLSDQQLAQSMQAPTGIPQYAIAAELNRRKQVRQQAGPQRQSTVVQDLLTQTPPSPIPMGEAVPQVPPPQPGGGLPYGAAVSPMGMAAGGRVSQYRAADPRRMNWSQIAKLLPGAEWGQRQSAGWTPVQRPQAPQMKTEDFVSAILPVLQEREEKVKQYEDGSLNRALMQAGFAMMASKDPTAFGGIGAGLQQGLSGWTADKAQTRDEMSKLAIQRAAAAAQQQQRAEAEAGRVSDWARQGYGADIVDAQLQNSSRQTDANLQLERDKWDDLSPQREIGIEDIKSGITLKRAQAEKFSRPDIESMMTSKDPEERALGIRLMQESKRNPDTSANLAYNYAALGQRKEEANRELEVSKIATISREVAKYRDDLIDEKFKDKTISMNPARAAEFDAKANDRINAFTVEMHKMLGVPLPDRLKATTAPAANEFNVDLKTGKFSKR
jgi:hypothetical protein